MEREEIIWVYVIRGSNGKYYTGMTKDLARRMKEHRSGTSTSTRSYGEIEVIWTKAFKGRMEARAMEVLIKKKGAARFIKTYGGQR